MLVSAPVLGGTLAPTPPFVGPANVCPKVRAGVAGRYFIPHVQLKWEGRCQARWHDLLAEDRLLGSEASAFFCSVEDQCLHFVLFFASSTIGSVVNCRAFITSILELMKSSGWNFYILPYGVHSGCCMSPSSRSASFPWMRNP